MSDYWPEPKIDESCLDIVGDQQLPIDYGAITEGTKTYWRCLGAGVADFGLDLPVITADLETWGPITLKVSNRDPWLDPLSCRTKEPGETIESLYARPSFGSRQALRARGVSLTANMTSMGTGGLRGPAVSTVVSGDFTLYVFSFRFVSASNTDCLKALLRLSMPTFTTFTPQMTAAFEGQR